MKKTPDPKFILRDIGREYSADEKFLKSLRANLVQYLKENPPVEGAAEIMKNRPFRWSFVRFLPVPVLGVLMLLTGTVFASQSSLPGDTLYSVKLASENARIAVTPEPQERAKLRIEFARERVVEIKKVLVEAENASVPKDPEVLSPALDNFTANLKEVSDYATTLEKEGDLPKAEELDEKINQVMTEIEREDEDDDVKLAPEENDKEDAGGSIDKNRDDKNKERKNGKQSERKEKENNGKSRRVENEN